MAKWIVILMILFGINGYKPSVSGKEYMVQIDDQWLEDVKHEAKKFGWSYKGKIVSNIYLFEGGLTEDSKKTIQSFKSAVKGKVLEVETREYSKIRFVPLLTDLSAAQDFKHRLLKQRRKPKIKKTRPYYGMDIQEAWSMGLTGQGINVAVVDSGVQLNNKDLERNINRNLSRSFTGDKTDNGNATRLRSYHETDIYTSHGTKVAGLIGAQFGNGICSAGVAFNAAIISLKVFNVEQNSIFPSGVQFLDDHITQALEYERNNIDIYSCSFGLANMFATSTIHIKTVLKEGITEGRNGKGSIYVFAAGNQGNIYDCNTVPYTNSIFTITIASVGKGGKIPYYSIPCSSVLASTYGTHSTYDGARKLITTTLDSKCDTFTGTSASAALASGIIALMLQANKNLSWRDVQHIIVLSSSFELLVIKSNTVTNGYNLTYNPHFGFGLMNATKVPLLARNWTTVPQMINTTADCTRTSETNSLLCEFQCSNNKRCCLHFIEHVQLNIEYNIPVHIENNLKITLKSPARTRSVLFHAMKTQTEEGEIIKRNWNFSSVQFWGENPKGTWKVNMGFRGIQDNENDVSRFVIGFASLTLFGTVNDPYLHQGVDSPTADILSHDCTTFAEENFNLILPEKIPHGREDEYQVEWYSDDDTFHIFIIILSILFGACVAFSVYMYVNLVMKPQSKPKKTKFIRV